MNFIERFFCFLFLVVSFSEAQSSPIDTAEAIDIGGIKQWISIKGTNDGNPVLLFLHGGPGNSAMGYAAKFSGELQKYFVVVHWDQRESGKTAELNASDKPLSVAVMESDAIDVINYLRKRFSRDKIYVMGHSWGGFLALKIAAEHPELLKACLAVSPMVDQLESERLSLKWMLDKAKQENNQEALKELQSVSVPFANGEQLYYHRSWLIKMAGRKYPSKSFVETWATKWLNVFNEGSAVNFFKTAPKIECPVYFFVGRKDYQTHFKLTEDYYNLLTAPAKNFYWFENSGHNLTTSEPAKLQEIIINDILPKTGG
ncbi:MAG TPA: alpha/beta hydrolase [Chryseolinea sp.]|nr:alpha/beta hydrolase [Chryseolinea sp.]